MDDEELKAYVSLIQTRTMVIESWGREIDTDLEVVGPKHPKLTTQEIDAVVKAFETTIVFLEDLLASFLTLTNTLQKLYIPDNKPGEVRKP